MEMSSEMVTVFVPTDPGEQALIESILDEAEIGYVAENSQIQNLFGVGQIGGYNPVVGPVRIQVAEEDAEQARQLIAGTLAGSSQEARPAELAEGAAEEEPLESSHDPAYRYATYSMVWSILSLGGVGSALAILFGIRALRLRHPSSRRSRNRAIFGLVLGIGGLVSWLLYWSFPYLGAQ
jgi:hypothetical protein